MRQKLIQCFLEADYMKKFIPRSRDRIFRRDSAFSLFHKKTFLITCKLIPSRLGAMLFATEVSLLQMRNPVSPGRSSYNNFFQKEAKESLKQHFNKLLNIKPICCKFNKTNMFTCIDNIF